MHYLGTYTTHCQVSIQPVWQGVVLNRYRISRVLEVPVKEVLLSIRILKLQQCIIGDELQHMPRNSLARSQEDESCLNFAESAIPACHITAQGQTHSLCKKLFPNCTRHVQCVWAEQPVQSPQNAGAMLSNTSAPIVTCMQHNSSITVCDGRYGEQKHIHTVFDPPIPYLAIVRHSSEVCGQLEQMRQVS